MHSTMLYPPTEVGFSYVKVGVPGGHLERDMREEDGSFESKV